MRSDVLSGLYCGPAPVPAELLWRWNLEPVLARGPSSSSR